ncbi:MAG: response regulator [Gammaproteobacteria bacterium]|nr:response regulator [Gammaproteobacteria bacterium]
MPSVRIHSPRILVVEDEVSVRKVIAMFLTYQGYDAVIATDARHALCLLDEQHFDLLLSDVMMPDMKGPELYAAALKIQPTLSVLFVSGYSEDMLIELPGSDECYSYLPKPFTLAQLDNAIQETAASWPIQNDANHSQARHGQNSAAHNH